MASDEIINVNDVNYAIYRIGNWKNKYEINQIGLSNEIPVTKNTVYHVKMSMDEIRMSQFAFSDQTVNGFVAIATQLNPKILKMDVDEIISLEKEEYENILDELDGLELLDEDGTVVLENEEYLIYKLQKECHVTTATPANEFTKKFHANELKKIEDALN